ATTAATAFALRPGVNEAVAAVAADGPLPDAGDVLFGPVVSLSAYVFMTTISVLKPWGRTRRGRRLGPAAGRPRRTAAAQAAPPGPAAGVRAGRRGHTPAGPARPGREAPGDRRAGPQRARSRRPAAGVRAGRREHTPAGPA